MHTYDEYNIDPLFDPELEIAEPTGDVVKF